MPHTSGYSRLQIALHWLIVAMVVVQLVAAESMTETVDAIEEGEAVSANTALLGAVHYWVGIAILLIMLGRLGLRLTRGVPAHSSQANQIQDIAATVVHYALYAALILAPISGLLAFYGIADVGDTHALVRPALFVLVILHILGAMYGQFVRKDGTLNRMLRPGQ